jgi:type III secretion protein V
MTMSAYFRSTASVRESVFARYSDLLLVACVVAIVAMMVLPLPAWLIDLLVAANIASGLLLLLLGIYIASPLEFSVFPSVLLMTTLFRLSLSIATTRMILLQGHAGHIIDTFGKVVAGGNLVVGLVVFLIITVVQFIVIAKGAERVAEVAARFSLDAMPGKQLSIDSDLRSGLIDKDEARRRRRTLELESKLHGSLDGAMKFVKGDAIAGIVIIVINLLGGLAIGVMQQDLDISSAMTKYSILTIGEGMVAQIPALLGAMAAGLIVTRTTDDEHDKHLGDAIRKQVTSKPRVLVVASAC